MDPHPTARTEASRAQGPSCPDGVHLVSDLDGTWIPSPDQVGDLRQLEAALPALPGLRLTFATGRGFDSALALLDKHVHVFPHHLVTDVGTRIHHRTPEGGWVEDNGYAAGMQAIWDPELRGALTGEGLPPGIRFQAGVAARFRLALEVEDPIHLQRAAVDLQLRLVLRRHDAHVLASGGRFLDVLPEGVDKGTAVAYLERGREPGAILIGFGDTENDAGFLGRADLAGLMPGGPLEPGRDGLSPETAFLAPRPGPGGILALLEAWGLLGRRDRP